MLRFSTRAISNYSSSIYNQSMQNLGSWRGQEGGGMEKIICTSFLISKPHILVLIIIRSHTSSVTFKPVIYPGDLHKINTQNYTVYIHGNAGQVFIVQLISAIHAAVRFLHCNFVCLQQCRSALFVLVLLLSQCYIGRSACRRSPSI